MARRIGAALLVLALAAGGVAEWQTGYVRDLVESSSSDAEQAGAPAPITGTEAQPAPKPSMTIPPIAEPAPLATPLDLADTQRPRRIEQALAPFLADEALGPRVHASVASAGSGRTLFDYGTDVVIPASTTKILTGLAALSVLGPDHTFTTKVLASSNARRIVLVGGGDPYLASTPKRAPLPDGADLRTLAADTAEQLRAQGRNRVWLDYDMSLFAGPAISPGWRAIYLLDEVRPIESLWVEGGRDPATGDYTASPALTATEYFASELAKRGIEVREQPRTRIAGPKMREIASAQSAPLSSIVERVLEISDNGGAELLAHAVGLEVRGEASFEAGIDGVTETLDRLGIDTAGLTLIDGSGLSRSNRIPAPVLLAALEMAASPAQPAFRSVITGLPVAGFTGSLADRFADAPVEAKGRVRAKTGTLSGVSALAGVATDLDGSTMAFVLAADRVDLADTLAARAALDSMAAALAACRCG